MVRPAGNAHEVAGLDLQRRDRLVGNGEMEDTATRDHEAHLVLVVPVLDLELVKHLIESWRVRAESDDVSVRVAALGLESIYVLAKRVEDCLCGRVVVNGSGGLPAFVGDADLSQPAADRVLVGDGQVVVRQS